MTDVCKILTVVGARPQFIKAAAVSHAFSKTGQISEILVHTGQHFDPQLSDVFFEELSLRKSDYNLGISGLSHGAMTGRMLEETEKVIEAENPDYVLVYGDTNSTLAGALAAKKLHKRVIHVEAGLRSGDIKMPEEVNRILTDRISDILFCPTEIAVANLKSEGYEKMSCKIINSGDVMLDALRMHRDRAKNVPMANIPEEFVLCTVHRAENTNDAQRLRKLFNGLDAVNKIVPVVIPLHPRTRKQLEKNDISTEVRIIDLLSYLEMIHLLDKCSLVMTDSGGLQKEAFFFNKFCLTLRDTTEWSELVEKGYNLMVGSDEEEILKGFYHFRGKKFGASENFYGTGNASEIISAEILEDYHQHRAS